MKTCITCGMPLEGTHAKDFGFQSDEGPVCIHDSSNGEIKPAEDIFEGGVQFFMRTVTHGDRHQALKLTRKNMNALPYWQNNPFESLYGPEATDAEFAHAMSKLSSGIM